MPRRDALVHVVHGEKGAQSAPQRAVVPRAEVEHGEDAVGALEAQVQRGFVGKGLYAGGHAVKMPSVPLKPRSRVAS